MIARIALIACLLLPGEVYAQDADDDGEWPREGRLENLRIKTAYPLEAGEYELELISSYLDFDDRKEYPNLLELEAGVSERLTLELEYGYLFVDSEDDGHFRGSGDLALEAKYLVANDGPLALAFALEAGSVGEVEEGEDEIERNLAVETYGALSYEVGDQLRAHLQAGFEAIRHEKAEKFLNFALEGHPLGIGLTPQLALNVEWEGDEAPETSLVPGFSIRLEGEPLKRIGLGVPIGLSDEAPDVGVILNVELEF